MRTSMSLMTVVAVGLVWAAVGAQEEQAKLPGPGSGIVKVTGAVEIANVPAVIARQEEAWDVTVANAPDVRVLQMPPVALAAPEFLKVKSRCDVIWGNGDRERLDVVQLGPGGWVRVGMTEGRQRWVNLALARSVEILP